MRWPWTKEKKEPRTTLKGVKLGRVRIDHPPDNAPDGMWLDFAALVGLAMSFWAENEWKESAAQDYLNRWGAVHSPAKPKE